MGENKKMIETAIKIAREAGKILLSYYQQDLNITDKGREGQDPVTEADMASHRFITMRLHQEFPDDQILSEENSNLKIDFSKRVWVVDPLDGTKQFEFRRAAYPAGRSGTRSRCAACWKASPSDGSQKAGCAPRLARGWSP